MTGQIADQSTQRKIVATDEFLEGTAMTVSKVHMAAERHAQRPAGEQREPPGPLQRDVG
jgi:hypothetical protein